VGRNPKSFSERGVAGAYDFRNGIRTDELLRELSGLRGIKKFREMREYDPTVGSVMSAIEMLARGATWSFTPAPADATGEYAKFAESIFEDMDFTFDQFLSDAMSFLTYGFSLFEIVLKRRADGRIGIKKFGPRAQWTVDRFDVDAQGNIFGVWQNSYSGLPNVYIEAERMLLLRPMSSYADPAGRSVLRNAYRSYVYAKHIQEYEAVAIERELNGLPVGRVPSDYLADDAPEWKKAFVNKFETILRDVKKNQQGFVMLPSDLQEDDDGKLSDKYAVAFDLVASNGSRDIDTHKVVVRHQQDIARTVLADFLTMGMNDRGSFAMSRSKSDIFIKAMQAFLNSICDPINRKVLPQLWSMNSFPSEMMPRLGYSNLAPVDIDELGKFIRSMALAGAEMFPDDVLESAARKAAGLPPTSARNVEEEEIGDDDDVV
jgi:hypothetical protein